jgi:hypothetical protein
MNKIFPVILLTIATTGVAMSQQTETRAGGSGRNDTSASKQGRQLNLQSGTQLTGQLQNTLDARHAKVGDLVIVKTTQAVKQDGEVIIPKGTRLLGHVTQVQPRTKSNGESRLGIAFDRLQNGSIVTSITATIVSITQARSNARASDNTADSDVMTSSSARSSSSGGGAQRGGGGLLGGVTNTVGGVANTTTSTAGNVTGSATRAVGSTVGTTSTVSNTTDSLRGLQITQSSSASADGGSTLSLSSGNLRLESGTTFNVLVSNSASAGNP